MSADAPQFRGVPSTVSGDETPQIELVVFDLGGVLVDLSGLDAFLDRHRLDPAEFWPRWLGTGQVADFERGTCTADEFAAVFLAEFDLDIPPTQLLAEFAEWPGPLLPGAAELVGDVVVRTATLSNTNEIHWQGAFARHDVLELFDEHFPSFRLGMAKPDPAIFLAVAERAGVDPERIVFVDDNQVNVDGARAAGLTAHKVVGPSEARQALQPHGVLKP
ncbi:hypothetical protein BH24ACT5_BH24ACT5_02280 [soil metagenome]